MTAPDFLTAQRQALDVLRDVLPTDFAAVSTVDPATLLWTSCVISGMEPDPHREALMFENEYRQDDLNKVSEIVRLTRPAARLSSVAPEVLARSPRYQALQGVGIVDELRCALIDDGNCWASLELYRTPRHGPFTDQDERTATAIGQPLARMIRLSLLREAASSPGLIEDPPGVLVLDSHGSVEGMSPGCERWLEEIGTNGPVPPAVRALVTRLGAGQERFLSTMAPRRSGGWVRLHTTGLQGASDQKTTVVLEPVKPAALAETVANAYSFTPREREVISCIARGLSSKEIAIHLGISPHTVNDHAKSVFRKANVQGRQQLIAKLFFDHCLPLRQKEAIPGPYGWFLQDEPLVQTDPQSDIRELGR